jgi:LmbE family N-acetylglucosaminyl deacetylase
MTTTGAPHKNLELMYRLRALGMADAILHVGTHPDDEDVGMMAYMARKMGARVVYWSATRGEGGQNRIGPYQGASLGVYRSWESLAARQVDGGEALFGPFIDFGFSKEAAKPLERWGQQEVVREIVRAIRMVQPHIKRLTCTCKTRSPILNPRQRSVWV